jgi:hypothetical protein
MSGKASNRMRSTGTSPSTEAVHHAPAAWPIWRTGLAIACGCNRPAESLQLNDRQTTTHPGRYISLPSAHSSAASSWPIPTGLNPIWRYDQWLCHQLLSVHNRGQQLKHLLLCNCYLEPRLRLHRAAAWVVSPCAMRRASSRVSMPVADSTKLTAAPRRRKIGVNVHHFKFGLHGHASCKASVARSINRS